MSDDGFIEIEPTGKAGPKHAPCTVVCTEMGRQKTPRLSLTFRLDLLDEDAAHILQAGPRFNAAYNPATHMLRLKADNMGRYETTAAPKTNGSVVFIRIPRPAGVVSHKVRLPVEVDANRQQRAVLIDLPKAFQPVRVALKTPLPAGGLQAPARGDVTSVLMGAPPPGRSALDKRRAAERDAL